MEYLLSPKNIPVLESFSLAHTVFGFDFDGTLAKIEDHPKEVRIDSECEKYLKLLNDTGPVAIITGRSIEDVKSFFSFPPKYIIGNHGIEGNHSPDELESIKLIIEGYKKVILDLYSENMKLLGIVLEDKVYSLTLHFRNSPEPEKAEHFLITKLSYFPKAKVTKGKMVLNIIPFNVTNKGQAFIRLMEKEKAKFGFYIGDDVTDEDVFVYKDPKILTVKIGYFSESQASYYLNDQDEIIHVLKILCGNRGVL
jgi:trehalose 6-phosphate phosphatase